MSFQSRGTYDVVACDVCNAIGAVGDTRIRPMRRDAAGGSHHLCSACRVWAEWCDTHQRYHLPDDMHRCACADCGGLFTARVRQHIAHCPGCLRRQAPQSAAAAFATAPAPSSPTRGLAGLVASLTRALRH